MSPGIVSQLVGDGTKPLALGAVANAWQRLVGPLRVIGSSIIAQDSLHVDGASDFMRAFRIPGMITRDLIAPTADAVVTAATAARFDAMRSIDDVSDIVGADNVAACHSLADLWERCRGSGFFTSDQINLAKAACLSGVLCYVASGRAVMNVWPACPPGLAAPVVNDTTRPKFDGIVARFDIVRKAYAARNFADATKQAQAAAADVAFWDTVYTVVKAVADAPATVAGAASDATMRLAGGILAKAWPLILMVGAAFGLYFFGPAILGGLRTRAAAKAAGNG